MAGVATLRELTRRARLMVGRCLLRRSKDGTGLQTLQVGLLKGETRDRVERFQEYGFTSRPHRGAEGVAVAVGGNRDHLLVIAVDDRRYRLQGLAEGEVALYTDEGDKIHLKRNGEILISAGAMVRVSAPTARVEATDVQVAAAGDVTVVASGDVDVTAGGEMTIDAALVHVDGAVEATGGVTAFKGTVDEFSLADVRDVYNVHTHDENDAGGPTDPPNQQIPPP